MRGVKPLTACLPREVFNQRFVLRNQQFVTGLTRVKLYKGACSVVGRRSARSLYRLDMATFEEDEVYRQKDAEGFIRLNALRLAIRASRRHAVKRAERGAGRT